MPAGTDKGKAEITCPLPSKESSQCSGGGGKVKTNPAGHVSSPLTVVGDCGASPVYTVGY